MAKIVAFHGSGSKAGTSMVAFSFAEMLAAKNKKAEVLYLCLCRGKALSYTDEKSVSIDFFKEKIDNSLEISAGEKENLRIDKNLFAIGGSGGIWDLPGYKREDILGFIEMLSTRFDYIVLDTGSDPGLQLSVGGLDSAEEKILVLSQNEASVSAFEDGGWRYGKKEIYFSACVLNRVERGDVNSTSFVARRLGWPENKIFALHQIKESREAEHLKKTFFAMGSRRFSKDLERVFEFLRGA